MRAAPVPQRTPRRRHALGHAVALTVHLARREASSAQRWTLLGRAWPLVRQLAQLAVLVFVFSAVLDLGVNDYAVFVFCGLIAWSWFASGFGGASWALLSNAHLLRQPSFPAIVLPLVATIVPLLDVLFALPVLGVMVATNGGIPITAVALPGLMVIQCVLMAGLAFLAASVSVYLRDIPNLVSLGTTLLFYMTPVFYPLQRVPAEYRWVLELNPIAQLLESYRYVLLYGLWPEPATIAWVTALSIGTAVVGFAVFRRLAPGVVDRL